MHTIVNVNSTINEQWEKKLWYSYVATMNFLTRMYGLSGASGKLKNNLHIRDAEVDKKTSWSGRHCCLWCHITSSQLSESPSSRAVTLRTNTTLERDLQAFESDGGDIKKAKRHQETIFVCCR